MSTTTQDNQTLAAFLHLLDTDIEPQLSATHHTHLQPLDAGLAQHLQSLVQGVEVDLDAELIDVEDGEE